MTTQVEWEQREREIERRRNQLMHEEFRARYAPKDHRERDRFEAHLSMLLHAIAKDAVQPFVTAAASALAMKPLGPLFIKKDDTL